jgi:2-polyprenyl-3-methyl-5-hydroxy-6-metoxy-1,4-benzoquinol methylase
VAADPGEPGWFNPIAEFLGEAYWAPGTTRVQAFTTGTEQEVDFLVDALALAPGMRILDAGCGPGRHALALAARGFDVLGVDLSPDFVQLARHAAHVLEVTHRVSFEIADLRSLEFAGEFDAVICLCQGGVGLLGGSDDEAVVLERFRAALRPGGRVAVSAFNAYFALRHLEAGDTFDAARGVNHEVATLQNAHGDRREFDLWTTCFTPRELTLMAGRAGLVVDALYGVMPGRYAATPPSIDLAEHLLLAHRPIRPADPA